MDCRVTPTSVAAPCMEIPKGSRYCLYSTSPGCEGGSETCADVDSIVCCSILHRLKERIWRFQYSTGNGVNLAIRHVLLMTYWGA